MNDTNNNQINNKDDLIKGKSIAPKVDQSKNK